MERVDFIEIWPLKSAIRSLIAFLEPIPVQPVINETIIPKETEILPMSTITLERLFLLSLERAILLEKYKGNFNFMNLTVKIKYLLLFCLIFLGLPKVFGQNKDKNCFKTDEDSPELYLQL